MNLQETNTLRRLDEAGQGIIGTQYGNVSVKSNGHGFVAVLHASSFDLAFCNTASGAFLKLADKIKSANK